MEHGCEETFSHLISKVTIYYFYDLKKLSKQTDHQIGKRNINYK